MNANDSFAPIEAEMLVAVIDVEGRVTYRNRSWIRLLGDGPGLWSGFDHAEADEAKGLFERARRGELLTNQLFLVPFRDSDTPRPLLLHFLPQHPTEGSPRTSSSCSVTITGEFLVQPESWTANQTERHRMETLGRMTMGMAHDFNNLLAAILGHVDLMRSANEASRSDLSEHLETIERAARDGASLVDKVQRYIRQEQQAAYGPVDIPSLIQDCISLTRPYWYNEPRRQGIDISVEHHLADCPPVMGSAAELRDVLVNMVLNAVQSMPNGGQIVFRAWSEDHRVFWSVADTGVGMTEAVQARIFEPMFTTKGDRGNGMGLAVANGIVQEHGGNITVVSRLDQGTRFTVDLPEAGDTTETIVQESIPSRSRTARILIVDDEAMVRTVLKRLLGLRGHQVEDAASGPEALERLARDPFDVVITDQGMPAMSGREFARLARLQFPDLPIILLSGDTHVGESDETVSDVLTKPFRIEDVEAAVQRHL